MLNLRRVRRAARAAALPGLYSAAGEAAFLIEMIFHPGGCPCVLIV
jgi:hypothetical protein